MGGFDCSAHDLSASKLFVLVDILYVQLCIEITIHTIRVSVKYHMYVSKELIILLETGVQSLPQILNRAQQHHHCYSCPHYGICQYRP